MCRWPVALGNMNAICEKIHRLPVLKESAANQRSRSANTRATPLERPVQRGCQKLYGSLSESGFSIEFHDFQNTRSLEWSQSSQGVELCLNVAGTASAHASRQMKLEFGPLTAAFYICADSGLRFCRRAGQQHRFIIVTFAESYLQEQLARYDGALHPLIERLVRDGSGVSGVGEVYRLTSEQEQLVAQLLSPPVFQRARGLWYQSKVMQLMVDFFFERRDEGELFCDRQKRVARERVDKVIAILRQHLAEPPELEEIGRRVGCSPFHLSRIFSKETGMTIPQYLRKLRMERAAELLQSGKCNVTEAAIEVGYSSLSHFSQAFCQTMGRCPGLYPLRRSVFNLK